MFETYSVKFIIRKPDGFITTMNQEIQIFYGTKDDHQKAEDAIRVLYKDKLVDIIRVTYI